MNIFMGTGNLGSDPTLTTKQIGDEDRQVCNFSVFFKKSKPDGNGGFVDAGGFWRDIAVWGNRAESCVKTLRKGCPVLVIGNEKRETWTDKESGEARERMVITSAHVGIDPIGVESITFTPKKDA